MNYLDDLTELDGGLKGAENGVGVQQGVDETQTPFQRRALGKSHLDDLAELDEGLKASVVLHSAFAMIRLPYGGRASERSHLEDLTELDEAMRDLDSGLSTQNGLKAMKTLENGTTRSWPMTMDELLNRYHKS